VFRSATLSRPCTEKLFIDTTDFSILRYNSKTKRLLIGPAVRLNLGAQLAVETDLLYQRVDYDFTYIDPVHLAAYESVQQVSTNRLQVPLLLQ
jgi:hypothetical protein